MTPRGGGRIGRSLAIQTHWKPCLFAFLLTAFVGLWVGQLYKTIHRERARAERAEEQIRRDARVMKMVDSLPRTVFLLEGRTPEEAANKLLDISSDVDGKRATILGETQFKGRKP